jgi:phenylacetate-CoA ligase
MALLLEEAKRLVHMSMISLAVPKRVALYALMKNRTGWDRDKIRGLQEERLRKIITYCWEYVPFYRTHWQQAISSPTEIKTISDLQKIPRLTKLHVRDNLETLTSTHPAIKSTPARTGGSTGQPVIFRMTDVDEQLAWAHMYVGWSWAGYRIGDPFLVVGGESVGVGMGDNRTFRDKVMNRWVSSGSNMTLERTKALVALPHFHHIRLIYGYPNSIRELCEYLAELNTKPAALRGVVCTAEVMRPEVRERIQQVLGVKVLDQYGLNDGGLHACEGPEQDGLHLSFHRGILEILDEQNQPINALGQPGRAVATLFSNLAMPFIRYETGDRVHWHSFEPSTSGVGWPRLGPIDGRAGDVLHFPSGRKVPMPGLTLVMRWIDGLDSYQFIQTDANKVTVRLASGPSFSWDEARVLQYLRDKIGDEVSWHIIWGAPELTPNGKLLIIRNDWLKSASANP